MLEIEQLKRKIATATGCLTGRNTEVRFGLDKRPGLNKMVSLAR